MTIVNRLKVGSFLFLTIIYLVFSGNADAGMWEVSLGASYHKKVFGEKSFTLTRTYGLSLGYYFTQSSQLEASYSDSFEETYNAPSGTIYRDKIYGLSWLQFVTGGEAKIKPYLKAGVSQVNRDQTQYLDDVGSITVPIDALSLTIGLGLRIQLLRNLGLRGEAKTYISYGDIGSWQDNIQGTLGASFFF